MNDLQVSLRQRFVRAASPFLLDVAFTASPGVTVLLGPSGSGKTTILNCIAGLLRPDEGSIILGGRTLLSPIVNLPLESRGVAYVFQDLALFPHLTVEANVGFGLRHVSPPERSTSVRAILQQFGIAHLIDQRPGQLSAGERQRVALARSLVTSPGCLLLDEPLSALDDDTRDGLLQDLRAWNEAHRIPILYVTHSRAEAAALGEFVILLKQGRIDWIGNTAALFTR
jgi:molybdate transport system ATP-binding protein